MFKKVESKNYRNYTDDKSGIQLEVNGEVDMSNAYAMAFNITFNTFPSKNHEKGYSAIVNLLDQKAIQRYVREVSELTKINTNILTASLNYIREDINEYKRNQKSRIGEVGSTFVGITDKEREEIEYYLSDKNLIAQLINDFNGIGISGNPDAVLLLYIACISRLTDLPIVLNCYGQTDIVRKLIEIIPSEFKIQMDSISANAPFYLTDKSKNKLIAVSSQNLTITEIDYLLKLSRNGLSKIQSNKNRVGEFITNSISADAGASIVFTSTKEKKLNKQGVYNIEISLSKEDEEKVKAYQRLKYTNLEAHSESEEVKKLLSNVQYGIVSFPVLIDKLDNHIGDVSIDEQNLLIGLIQSITILFQYQRKRKKESGIEYLLSTEVDLKLALKLFEFIKKEKDKKLTPKQHQYWSKYCLELNKSGLKEFYSMAFRVHSGLEKRYANQILKQLENLNFINGIERDNVQGKKYAVLKYI